jgi:hypothetical protein
MWSPQRFDERRAKAREKVRDHRNLLGAGSGRTSGDGGNEGARG